MSNDNNQDLSFLEKKDANALTGKDIFFTLIRNIHWFILFAVIGAAVAYYKVDRADRIYESHSKIIISSVTRNRMNNGVSMLENITNRRVGISLNAINDELIVLKSETPMLEVAKRLGLEQNYKCQTKLIKRVKDLYKESPIDVKMLDISPKDYASLVVTLQKDSSFVINIGELDPVKGHLGDTVSTSIGRVIVNPTWALRELYYDNPITVNHSNILDVAALYRSKVSIVRNSINDAIINLSIRDTSPERAADVLNELVAVYNETTINEKKHIIELTSDYINTRIAQLDSDLGTQESQIANFKRDNQLLSLDDYGQNYLNASIESKQEIERLNAQISHAEYLLQLTNENTDNNLFPVSVDINDENIKSTISHFNELVLKLDKYKNSGTTNNPIVQDMNVEMASMKNNLRRLLTAYIGSMNQKIGTVQAAGERASDQIRQVPGRQLYIDNVTRVQGIKEQLYLTLLSKREELLISQPSIEGNAKVIDRARVNRSPVAPNTTKSILMGLLLGLCFPILCFVMSRMLDTRVRYRKDIEAYVDIPILGEIPSKAKGDDRRIVVADSKRDQISEAFRILRSNIEYTRNLDKSATTYLFLSLMEGSGKTFLTSNLAASLGLVNKKVIILDLDLRKGTLTHNSAPTKMHGMSTYLSGKTDDIDSIITHDIVAPGVDAIFSGSIPPNPAELLSSDRLAQVFAYLKERYEYIIIDAVPAGIVADADIIKKYADVSVFLIRSNMVDKRMLPDIQALKDQKKFPNMSIILNGVKYKKRKGYGSGYGYGYGYGYGNYGYGYGQQYGYGLEDGESHRHKNKHHKKDTSESKA